MSNLTKSLRIGVLERENMKLTAELATLRLIVTEKFARELEVVVKPENAADVANWNANAEHVRELLMFTPVGTAEFEFGEWVATCHDCGENVDSGTHAARCRVAAAWHALGDRRGAEDIERAHVAALLENLTRRPRPELPPMAWRPINFDTPQGLDTASRRTSDARGMDAVEDEARGLNALSPEDTAGILEALGR